jgi:hypothetical protein
MVITIWNSFLSMLRTNVKSVSLSSRRRRVVPRLSEVERIEERLLLTGNLSLVDAYLTDAAGTRLTASETPVIGEAIYLRVDWQESGLVSADHYQLGFQLNQFSINGAPSIGYFAGQGSTVSQSFTQFAGYAKTGFNSATVNLDVGHTVNESDETDNLKVLSFTAADPVDPATPTLDLPQTLVMPVTGVPYKDWYLSYADSDPRPVTSTHPEYYQDYLGGKFTTDQQFGDHYVETNFSDMDSGRVTAVAVASGTVTSVVDGQFDRETSNDSTRVGNSVTIDLGNGWSVLYSNFLANSITVKVGDAVEANDPLGLLGSSGDSIQPQLTFELMHNGQVVEPGYSPAKYFVSPLTYASAVPFSVIDSGITNTDPAPDYSERPQDYSTFSTGGSASVWLWLQANRNLFGEPITVTWYKPNGSSASTQTVNPTINSVGLSNVFSLPSTTYKTATGTWQVAVTVGGVEVLRKNFSVAAALGAPEVRVQQETVLPSGLPGTPVNILNDRTTPVDFGTLNPGDPTKTITFTIQNTGATALSISNFQVPAGYISFQGPPFSIPAGGSGQFSLQQFGFYDQQSFGDVTFTTNDPDEPNFRFPVNGFVNESAGGPTIDLSGPATTYLFQMQPQLIAPDAQVVNFGSFSLDSNSSLTVSFAAGGQTEDVLGIRNQGTGAGLIGVAGTNITYGGTTIGTFTLVNDTTTNAQKLTISFNGNESKASVVSLMQNITYANSSVKPITHPRYVQFNLDVGFPSNLPAKMIDVVPDVKPPQLALVITPVTLAGSVTQDFQVNYTDEVSVDGSTPGATDITTILSPSGQLLTPTYLAKDSTVNGLSRTTSWTLAAPGGFWDVRDNGVYKVMLQPNEVKDINGNISPAQVIGTFTINIPNQLPAITSSLGTQSTFEDTPTGPISIRVSDLETDPAALVLAASSSDSSIVAGNGFTFTGTGATRTLVITPVANAFGTTTITVQVFDDNGGVTSKSFLLNVQSVNDLPVISQIPSQDIQQDTSTPAINFTVSDIETPAGSLLVVATSDNPVLIKNSKIVVGGTPGNPTLVITPEAGKFGRANVIITVTDTDGGVTTEAIPVLVRQTSLPPVIPANQVLSVPENSVVGTTAGTVSASDPDVGQTLTYAIVGGDSNNAFTINTSTGVISVHDPLQLDFETRQQFSLIIAATDSSFPGVTTNGVVTVNVTDVNEAPVVQSKTLSLNENPLVGTTVTVVTATDVDAGQTRTFSITGGNPNNAFVIDPATGALTVNNSTAVDYETNPTIVLTITATDNGVPSLSGSGTVTLHLGNVNEAPIINAQSLSVPENSLIGTAVGSVLANDPDIGQTLTYSIVSGNADGAFAIDPITGALTVAKSSALDFEAQPTHQLIIQVADNASPSLTAANIVTISLTDVNEAPTISPQSFTLDENSPAGTVVGTVVAGNPETSQTLQYSIAGGNVGGAFSINSITGILQVANSAALNFETKPQFSLTIQATDNGTPALTTSSTITVQLNDVNEVPLIQDQVFTPNENLAVGDVAAAVVATDPDAGQSLTYSITGASVPGAFAIDPVTGHITVVNAAAVNFEVNPTITINVQVTDNGTNPLSSAAVVTLNLKDINDAPVVPVQTFTFDENQLAGYVVGLANATDEDLPPQTLTYSIVGGDNGGAFAINPSTGLITVVNAGAVDFETNPQFQLQVQARDNGSPARNGIGIVTINLNDVNEPPIVPTQTLIVPENSLPGFVVGQVRVDNPELNQTLTYQVLSGNEAGAFAVDPNSGTVTVVDSTLLNFESPTTFVLSIQVTDNGSPSLTRTGQLTITISDVNEAPVFATPYFFTINENSPAGSVLGTLHATDPDPGQTVVYTIINGNLGNAFALDPISGALTVRQASALDFETTQVFNLTIQAMDNGVPTLTKNTTVSISLRDVNDPPKISDQAFQLDENTANQIVVGTVIATDQDAGQTVSYQIDSGNDGGAFAINPATGVLTVANSAAVDFETHPTFQLVIRVTDTASPTPASSTGLVTVSLRNLNEPPVIPAQSLSIPENSAPGTLIGAVNAHDPEPGQTIQYSIDSGNINGVFAINVNTGVLTVANPAALDFETNPTIVLVVRGTDNANPPLSATGFVTINVLDVNEKPVVPNQALTIPENTPNGTVIGTVVATDPDGIAGLQYSMTAGNLGNAFRIDPITGAVIVNNSSILNFEARQIIIVTVTATDVGGLSSSGTMTVTLTNVNDPPQIADAFYTVAENSVAGTTLGTMSATDEDFGQKVSYSIVSGNTNGAFAINSLTGKITVANASALDFETTPVFTIGIEATDTGNPSASTVATATVNLTNVDEPLTISFPPGIILVQPGQKNVLVASKATAQDVDSPETDLLGVTLTVNLASDSSNRADKLTLVSGVNGLTVVKGKTLMFNNLNVGTIAGGKAGSPLFISFTADATSEALQAVVRSVAVSLSGKHSHDTLDVKFRLSGSTEVSNTLAVKTLTITTPQKTPRTAHPKHGH